MDLHIGQLTSEVEVGDSTEPLSAQQIERIVALVVARLEQRERDRRLRSEAMSLQQGFLPRMPWE